MALTWSVWLRHTRVLAMCSRAWAARRETNVTQGTSSKCLRALATCEHSVFPRMLSEKVSSILCNKHLAQIYYLQCQNCVKLHIFCLESGECAGIKYWVLSLQYSIHFKHCTTAEPPLFLHARAMPQPVSVMVWQLGQHLTYDPHNCTCDVKWEGWEFENHAFYERTVTARCPYFLRDSSAKIKQTKEETLHFALFQSSFFTCCAEYSEQASNV